MVDHKELEKSISNLGIDITFLRGISLSYQAQINLKNHSCL
jgi:hypothetical protein